MTLVATLTLAAATPATADSISDKRTEAAAIASRLEDQAREIVALDADFRQAQAALADAQAAEDQAQAEYTAATKRQAILKVQLTAQARDAYVLGGSINVLRYLVGGDDPVARRAYLRVVSGQDRSLVDQLRASREDLNDLHDRLTASRKRAADRASAIGEDRASLDKAIRLQKSALAQVSGELAELVAAEQARRDAEAAREAAAASAKPSGSPAAAPAGGGGLVVQAPSGDTFACIRQLESGNNYATPGGGAYQFLDSTWHALGYSGTASDAPPAVQDQAARDLQARAGWSQWTTAALCGRV